LQDVVYFTGKRTHLSAKAFLTVERKRWGGRERDMDRGGRKREGERVWGRKRGGKRCRERVRDWQ
jgi:hypothetical protein